MQELFNETIIQCFMSLIFVFTDWVPDAEVRYNMGWVGLGLVAFNIFVSMILLILTLYGHLRLR